MKRCHKEHPSTSILKCLAQLGVPESPEAVAKRAAKIRGRKESSETKAIRSVAAKKRANTDDGREQARQAGQAGAHKRHHENKNVRKPGCKFCEEETND